MEKTLSMGAFTELDEREVMEVEGGVIEWIIIGVVGAVAFYEPLAQTVDKGNDKMAQLIANDTGKPYTQPHYSIWNNITGNTSYTAYPEK